MRPITSQKPYRTTNYNKPDEISRIKLKSRCTSPVLQQRPATRQDVYHSAPPRLEDIRAVVWMDRLRGVNGRSIFLIQRKWRVLRKANSLEALFEIIQRYNLYIQFRMFRYWKNYCNIIPRVKHQLIRKVFFPWLRKAENVRRERWDDIAARCFILRKQWDIWWARYCQRCDLMIKGQKLFQNQTLNQMQDNLQFMWFYTKFQTGFQKYISSDEFYDPTILFSFQMFTKSLPFINSQSKLVSQFRTCLINKQFVYNHCSLIMNNLSLIQSIFSNWRQNYYDNKEKQSEKSMAIRLQLQYYFTRWIDKSHGRHTKLMLYFVKWHRYHMKMNSEVLQSRIADSFRRFLMLRNSFEKIRIFVHTFLIHSHMTAAISFNNCPSFKILVIALDQQMKDQSFYFKAQNIYVKKRLFLGYGKDFEKINYIAEDEQQSSRMLTKDQQLFDTYDQEYLIKYKFFFHLKASWYRRLAFLRLGCYCYIQQQELRVQQCFGRWKQYIGAMRIMSNEQKFKFQSEEVKEFQPSITTQIKLLLKQNDRIKLLKALSQIGLSKAQLTRLTQNETPLFQKYVRLVSALNMSELSSLFNNIYLSERTKNYEYYYLLHCVFYQIQISQKQCSKTNLIQQQLKIELQLDSNFSKRIQFVRHILSIIPLYDALLFLHFINQYHISGALSRTQQLQKFNYCLKANSQKDYILILEDTKRKARHENKKYQFSFSINNMIFPYTPHFLPQFQSKYQQINIGLFESFQIDNEQTARILCYSNERQTELLHKIYYIFSQRLQNYFDNNQTKTQDQFSFFNYNKIADSNLQQLNPNEETYIYSKLQQNNMCLNEQQTQQLLHQFMVLRPCYGKLAISMIESVFLTQVQYATNADTQIDRQFKQVYNYHQQELYSTLGMLLNDVKQPIAFVEPEKTLFQEPADEVFKEREHIQMQQQQRRQRQQQISELLKQQEQRRIIERQLEQKQIDQQKIALEESRNRKQQIESRKLLILKRKKQLENSKSEISEQRNMGKTIQQLDINSQEQFKLKTIQEHNNNDINKIKSLNSIQLINDSLCDSIEQQGELLLKQAKNDNLYSNEIFLGRNQKRGKKIVAAKIQQVNNKQQQLIPSQIDDKHSSLQCDKRIYNYEAVQSNVELLPENAMVTLESNIKRLISDISIQSRDQQQCQIQNDAAILQNKIQYTQNQDNIFHQIQLVKKSKFNSFCGQSYNRVKATQRPQLYNQLQDQVFQDVLYRSSSDSENKISCFLTQNHQQVQNDNVKLNTEPNFRQIQYLLHDLQKDSDFQHLHDYEMSKPQQQYLYQLYDETQFETEYSIALMSNGDALAIIKNIRLLVDYRNINILQIGGIRDCKNKLQINYDHQRELFIKRLLLKNSDPQKIASIMDDVSFQEQLLNQERQLNSYQFSSLIKFKKTKLFQQMKVNNKLFLNKINSLTQMSESVFKAFSLKHWTQFVKIMQAQVIKQWISQQGSIFAETAKSVQLFKASNKIMSLLNSIVKIVLTPLYISDYETNISSQALMQLVGLLINPCIDKDQINSVLLPFFGNVQEVANFVTDILESKVFRDMLLEIFRINIQLMKNELEAKRATALDANQVLLLTGNVDILKMRNHLPPEFVNLLRAYDVYLGILSRNNKQYLKKKEAQQQQSTEIQLVAKKERKYIVSQQTAQRQPVYQTRPHFGKALAVVHLEPNEERILELIATARELIIKNSIQQLPTIKVLQENQKKSIFNQIITVNDMLLGNKQYRNDPEKYPADEEVKYYEHVFHRIQGTNHLGCIIVKSQVGQMTNVAETYIPQDIFNIQIIRKVPQANQLIKQQALRPLKDQEAFDLDSLIVIGKSQSYTEHARPPSPTVRITSRFRNAFSGRQLRGPQVLINVVQTETGQLKNAYGRLMNFRTHVLPILQNRSKTAKSQKKLTTWQNQGVEDI